MTAAPLGAVASAAVLSAGCVAEVERRADLDREVERTELTALPAPVFTDVLDVAAVTDGIWVLDATPPFVTFLPADGSPPVRMAFRGMGPDELERPVGLAAAGDSAVITDAERRLRLVLKATGAVGPPRPLLGEAIWIRPDFAEVSHIDPWRARLVAGLTLWTSYPGDLTHATDHARGTLVASDSEGSTRALVALSDHIPTPLLVEGQFPALPMWDACGDALFYWDPAGQRVTRVDLLTDESTAVSVPADPVPIELDGIERYLARMVSMELGRGAVDSATVARRAREVQPVFGQVASPFVDLRCDALGGAWLQEFDQETDPLGRGRRWVRARPGDAPARVRFPERFRPHLFLASGVVGVLSSPDGDRMMLWTRADASLPETAYLPSSQPNVPSNHE